MQNESWFRAGKREKGLFKDYSPLFDFERSRSGALESWVCPSPFKPGRGYGQPIDWSNRELVVRDDVRAAIESLAPSQFQALPIEFDRKEDVYWIMNRAVVLSDAIEFTDEDYDFDRPPRVDIALIPAGIHAFTSLDEAVSYAGPIVSRDLKLLLERIDPNAPAFKPVACSSTASRSPTYTPSPFASFEHPLAGRRDKTKSTASAHDRAHRTKPQKRMPDVLPWLRPLADLAASEDSLLGKGASEKQIETLEGAVGITLPPRYREFLLTFGWASVDGIEVLGIGTAPSRGGPSETAIAMTRQFRRQQTGWPAGMLAFCEDGRGGCLALDLTSSGKSDCPVLYYDHELQDLNDAPRFERASPSFKAWLDRLCDTNELPMP